MKCTYQIVILDSNQEVREYLFTTDANTLVDVLFEYECHCRSAYLDELTEDEDNSELTDELTRIRNNINLSTMVVGDTAYRLSDDETEWVECRLTNKMVD
jgi:hypothetical protein